MTFSTPASGDVAQTLNGTVNMTLANGKIMKLDLPGELSKIGKFGGVSPKGYTAVSQMSGTYNIHERSGTDQRHQGCTRHRNDGGRRAR